MPQVADSAYRILWPLFAVGAFDTPNNYTAANDVRTPTNTELAKNFSAAGIVLLKNNGILPLATPGDAYATSGSGSSSGGSGSSGSYLGRAISICLSLACSMESLVYKIPGPCFCKGMKDWDCPYIPKVFFRT